MSEKLKVWVWACRMLVMGWTEQEEGELGGIERPICKYLTNTR